MNRIETEEVCFQGKKQTKLILILILINCVLFVISGLEAQAQVAPEPQSTPRELVEALQKKEVAIQLREKNVAEEETRLKVLKAEIQSMLDEYGKLKEIVDLRESEHTKKLKAEAEKRMIRLAKIYQSMPPKEAATRMTKMSKKTALKLLRKIKEKQAAKILSKMSVERATRFSEDYAMTER